MSKRIQEKQDSRPHKRQTTTDEITATAADVLAAADGARECCPLFSYLLARPMFAELHALIVFPHPLTHSNVFFIKIYNSNIDLLWIVVVGNNGVHDGCWGCSIRWTKQRGWRKAPKVRGYSSMVADIETSEKKRMKKHQIEERVVRGRELLSLNELHAFVSSGMCAQTFCFCVHFFLLHQRHHKHRLVLIPDA